MSDRTGLRRKPERAVEDLDAIHAVLDEGLLAHVGLVAGGGDDAHPVVIPMLYARDGERLLLHGSPASRLLRTAKAGVDVCVTVTLLDALVLARSGLHHSMNYRSVVVMGRATEITDHAAKVAALDRLVEHTIPGRTSRVRVAHDAEVKGTIVLTLPLLWAGDRWVRPALKSGSDSGLNDRSGRMVGQRVTVVGVFSAGQGRVRYGDTEWSAQTVDGSDPEAGAHWFVTEVRGVILMISPAAVTPDAPAAA